MRSVPVLGLSIAALSIGLLGLSRPDPNVVDPMVGDGLADDDDAEVVNEGTITKKRPPPLKGSPGSEEDENPYSAAVLTPEEWAAFEALIYEPIVYKGAAVLSMPPEFIYECRQGLELIYLRDYKGAKEHFDRLSTQYEESTLGPIGQALIWQALMIENFDFKYSSQYEVAFRETERRLLAELAQEGNEAWEQFLLGGMMGLDAIHTMRTGNFISALSKGFDAIKALGRCKELAPEFKDALLGDGIYNYWRSVVTMNSKVLPSFGDHRQEGIEQTIEAERYGIFVRPPASLSLAFAYLEERELKRALGYTLKVRRHYPDNVINNLFLARIHVYMRNYQEAEEVLNGILAAVPDNERSHYYLSIIYSRTQRLPEALVALDTYLAFDLIPEYRAQSLYRKGNILFRQKEYDAAEECYKQAWDVDKHKGAKRRLARMKQMRKDGKID